MNRRVLVVAVLAACTAKPPTEPAHDGGGRTSDGGGRTAAVSEWGTDAVEVERQGMPIALTGITVEAGKDSDTVTFLFDANLTGHRVGYIEAPADCGSGEPSAVGGAAWLEVRLYPATGHTEEGQPLISAVELPKGLEVVQDVRRTCDFEAVVTWVVGTTGKRPFKTQELLDPQRLVVDIQH